MRPFRHPDTESISSMARPQGTHEDFARDETIEGSTDRGFGLVFAGVCAFVGTVKFFTGTAGMPYWFVAAAAFLAAALLFPKALAPLNRLWTRFGLVLYAVMNPLVMGLMFFLVITPIGLVMRLTGKDFLARRFDPAAPSYWVRREPPGPAPETMQRQF